MALVDLLLGNGAVNGQSGCFLSSDGHSPLVPQSLELLSWPGLLVPCCISEAVVARYM